MFCFFSDYYKFLDLYQVKMTFLNFTSQVILKHYYGALVLTTLLKELSGL